MPESGQVCENLSINLESPIPIASNAIPEPICSHQLCPAPHRLIVDSLFKLALLIVGAREANCASLEERERERGKIKSPRGGSLWTKMMMIMMSCLSNEEQAVSLGHPRVWLAGHSAACVCVCQSLETCRPFVCVFCWAGKWQMAAWPLRLV